MPSDAGQHELRENAHLVVSSEKTSQHRAIPPTVRRHREENPGLAATGPQGRHTPFLSSEKVEAQPQGGFQDLVGIADLAKLGAKPPKVRKEVGEDSGSRRAIPNVARRLGRGLAWPRFAHLVIPSDRRNERATRRAYSTRRAPFVYENAVFIVRR